MRGDKTIKRLIVFLSVALFVITLIPLNQVKADEEKLAVFRPFYLPYGEGTVSVEPNTNLTSITREWNFEAWNISEWYIKIRFCVPESWVVIGGGEHVDPAFYVILYVSVDNGTTYPYELDYEVGYLIYTLDYKYGGWCYHDWIHHMEYPVNEKPEGMNVSDLFRPTTRIKVQLFRTWVSVYPFYLGTAYWGSIQKPVPPYDYIDEEDTYVQYYIQFYVNYIEKHIDYKGQSFHFPYEVTQDKLIDSANMVLNCTHPSGTVNEVVNKIWGTDTWIILYSSELSMMKLIDLCSIFPNQSSHYLVTAKRFIVYLLSKQHDNGSFPFILTDGDQHQWFNETTGDYYGYDTIDSFSACAISLMRKYYDATEDLDFINSYWNQIALAKDFVNDLVNETYWLPVDGYHYNGTHYELSQMNWLHDCCEAYQGLKDYAYLEGERGNSTEETYWNNYAESIANGIRTYFWNETEQRYAGMFYVNNGTQNLSKVYNVITPLIYGLETNVTHAFWTVDHYVHWGILSGRYYDVKWAEDYNVYNEYSTMSGMIYTSFYFLINDFNYTVMWMKLKFLEIGKFLFQNPIYPEGDLQNDDGWLDYVNLINYTYAKEYARLVESSAWLIDGLLKLPNMTEMFTFSVAELSAINDTLCQQDIFWNQTYQQFKDEQGHDWFESIFFPKWVQWLKNKGMYIDWYDYMFLKFLFENGYLGDEPWWEKPLPDDWIIIYVERLPNYVPLFCGLFGFLLIVASPSYAIKKLREGEYSDGIAWGMVMFVIGIALVIVWLW